MKNIVFLMFLSLIMACAASKKEVAEDLQNQGQKTAYDESFDPLSLNDDDLEIKVRKTERRVSEDTEQLVDTNNISAETKRAQGFRVQIIATGNIESATITRQRASEQFGIMDYKAYLVYEAPKFKIRVGDALTRAEAEKIRDLARDYGYKGAFIVRSEVIIHAPQDQ